MNEPRSMQAEADHAVEVEKQCSPFAMFWRGDVRPVLRHGVHVPDLSPGRTFNLVDDSNWRCHGLLGQYRVLTMTRAPEGYVAVFAVESTAVPSQIPDVLMSQVIKSVQTKEH